MGLAEILIPVVLILVVLSLLKCPIYVSILGAAIYLQMFVNQMSLGNLFTGFFEAMTKSSLMAVPYFMVCGSIIAASSLGQRLINVFIELLKAVRGGFPVACVIANGVFGAISGSGPAATAVFGKVCHKPLSDRHGEKLALGVIVSSASLSTIIPPSISMIIYGVATETSITKMFLAGFIPGAFIVLVVSAYLVIVCKRNPDAPRERFEPRAFGKSLWQGIPVLILPVIVLGGVYSGLCSPTESGAIAALYSFVVAVFILRDIKPNRILPVLKDSARTTVQVFALIATSTVFSQAATVAQLPARLQAAFADMGQIQFLLMLNVLLLIMGCFFDTGAAILILAPMLLPTALALDISAIHLGIVFVTNLAIGLFTPPFGLNIFVAQSVLKRPMGLISKALVPYIIIYIACILIITYIPWMSEFLPAFLG